MKRDQCVLFCWSMLRRLRHLIPAIVITIGSGHAQAQAEEHTFRIRFGLTDSVPTAWDGSVTVSGGRVASLRSWRLRKADSVGESSWKLSTTPGRQFRYRNWEPEPSFPVPAYLNHVGLILTIDSDSDARIDIATAGGSFSFRLSEQPPATRVGYLGGAAVVERAANYRSVSEQDFDNGFAMSRPKGMVPFGWRGSGTATGPITCLSGVTTAATGERFRNLLPVRQTSTTCGWPWTAREESSLSGRIARRPTSIYTRAGSTASPGQLPRD